ncbi:MAG: hypothetical protein HY866_01145, partial [Chloroflexi bacterium]|nr:hypothetical protein [Chloroflexota bacterium]
MRVVINQKLVDRNRKMAHFMFFISLAGMGIGFFYTWTADPNSQTSQLSCLILPMLLMLTLASVRLANLWVREPRPVNVLNEALKGLGKKYTLFHHLLPAPHVLVGPEGVFSLTIVWQERAYRVKGKKWFGDEGLLRKLNGYMRQDLIGNPFTEATFHARETQRLIDKLAPGAGIEVQPLIVLINPKAFFLADQPLRPVLYADVNKKPSVRGFLREQTTAHPTLTQDHLDQLDRSYGLMTRQELAELAGGDFEDDSDTETDLIAAETGVAGVAESGDSTAVGTVFVLQSGQLYYIGATQGEIEAAVETVKAEAQRDVELIHSFETKNPEGVKDVLHRRF